MKRLLIALSVLILPSWASAATCFWVGGTGNWSDTTHWSIGTGGAGSTCLATGGYPNTGADSATIDASSGAGTITIDVSVSSTGTFTNGAMGMTLADGGNAQTWGAFSGTGTGTRTYNLTAAKWTITGATTPWTLAVVTNATFTSLPTLIESTNTGSVTFQLGTVAVYNDITFSGVGVTAVLGNTTWTMRDLTVTNGTSFTPGTPTGTLRNVSITAGSTAGSGTLSVTGNVTATVTSSTATTTITLAGSSGTQAVVISGPLTGAWVVNNTGAATTFSTSGWTPGALTLTAGSVTVSGSAIVGTGAFTHTAGTLVMNAPITTTTYTSSNTNTRSLTLTRPWTLTAVSTLLNVGTSTNFTASCSAMGGFVLSDASGTAKSPSYSGSEILKCIKYMHGSTTNGWTVTP